MIGEQVELPDWVFHAFTAAQIAEGDERAGMPGSRLWWRSVLAVSEVPTSVRIVAAVLQDRMGATSTCTLGVPRIARTAGLAEPTARAALRLLEANRWLQSEHRRKADGSPTTSRYELEFPAHADVKVLAVDKDGEPTDFVLQVDWTSWVGTDPRRKRCAGRRADGEACRREPKRGTDRCHLHPQGVGSSATDPPIAEPMGVGSSATQVGSSADGGGSLSYPDVSLDVSLDVFPDVFHSDEASTPLRGRRGAQELQGKDDDQGQEQDPDGDPSPPKSGKPKSDRHYDSGQTHRRLVDAGKMTDSQVRGAARKIEDDDARARFIAGYDAPTTVAS